MKQFVDLTGQIPVFYDANKLQHVSLPKNYTATDLTAAKLHEVVRGLSHDRETQKLSQLVTPVQDDNARTYTVVEVVAKPDADILEIKRAQKLAFVRAEKERLQNSILFYNGVAFEINETSKATLNSAITLNMHATISNAHGGVWKGVSKTVPMTDAELLQFGAAVGVYTLKCFERKQVLKAAIEAATTIAEIDAIDVGGWPDNGVHSSI